MKKAIVYDIESYPTLFSFAYCRAGDTSKSGVFIVSPYQNDIKKLFLFLDYLRDNGFSMIGFNNSEYDWLLLDWIYQSGEINPNLSGDVLSRQIYEYNDYLFTQIMKHPFTLFKYKGQHKLWPGQNLLQQVDLFKIHRLDGPKIGLKTIQFNIGFPSIRVLPYPPGTELSRSQIDEVIDYNLNNDVMGTHAFYLLSEDRIKFRESMGASLGKDFMCASDVKIAEAWFKKKLEDEGVITYFKDEETGDRIPNQTRYPDGFYLDDIIFDCIEFKSEEFKAVKKWLSSQHITETKGLLSKLPASKVEDILPFVNPPAFKRGVLDKVEILFAGVPFVFGLGGIHASIESQYVESTKEKIIKDLDVKSYYPSIIATPQTSQGNTFYVCPRHIGKVFCEIVKEVRDIRFKTPKSDSWNLMYKLILNAFTYGKLNEDNSFVFDPKTAMTVTINGQLMLCMLAEWVHYEIPDAEIIQANTDGITVRINREDEPLLDTIVKRWEEKTGYIMESAIYKFMAISNVNNYIAMYDDVPENGDDRGKMKLKGQYLTKPTYEQDFSSLVIQKAVAEYFKSGMSVEEFIKNHPVDHDFMLRINIDSRFKLRGLKYKDENKGVESGLSITEQLMFQRIINRRGVSLKAFIDSNFSQKQFIQWVREDFARGKGISIDSVSDKDVARRSHSYVKRAEYLTPILEKEYNIKTKIANQIARWYFRNGGQVEAIGQVLVKTLPKVTAYYMSESGYYLFKETLPTKKYPGYGGFTGLQVGNKVLDCNDTSTFDRGKLNYQWYIDEAIKMIEPIDKKGG